ncbi:Hypothetical predicted protein [Mytilus galloprovincialis]|uniref:Uncharacterized protein n=1 Tax=Mytilus galloprovincialis TaxID=29158 RepID=A0A8B6EP94_MYTGA|nr:Hypothetical predicted protein [Mytilus galloprovincialis]
MVEYIVPFLCLMSVAQCYKYCVIGAGPGGVQIGFYLQKLGRDYIIFERSNQAECGNLEDYMIVRKKDGLYLTDADEEAAKIWGQFENDPLQKPYDQIIRCLGFRFDTSIFSNQLFGGYKRKYPLITPDYQSTEIPVIYIVGTATHLLDHRKSARGFIHGFRYSARALNKILSWRYHGETWPKQAYSISNLLPVTVKRINEASGIYQMFGQLVDVILINSISFEYLEEFPINSIREFGQITGESISNKSMIVLGLEYGEDYHGPSEDIFREDRSSYRTEICTSIKLFTSGFILLPRPSK